MSTIVLVLLDLQIIFEKGFLDRNSLYINQNIDKTFDKWKHSIFYESKNKHGSEIYLFFVKWS